MSAPKNWHPGQDVENLLASHARQTMHDTDGDWEPASPRELRCIWTVFLVPAVLVLIVWALS